ncbi:MAG: hypothetical protein DDT20_01579 [Firmicutes bacterium]|nr:hypothetical protein [Bacillota bacterium]
MFLKTPRISDHFTQVALCAPVEHARGAGGICKAGGHIASAPWGDFVGHSDAVFCCKGVYKLKHGCTFAGAEVKDTDAWQEFLKRGHMPFSEVDNVDIVAHTGAVRGVIIVAKHAQAGQ